MERFLIHDLIKWKKNKNKKPLLLSGARQVGKTWLMKEFGEREYEHHIYINFDKDTRLHELFESTLEPKRIIAAISLIYGGNINPDNTLIIFDEVQEEPRALSSLKYFCEDAPEYSIIAAGSFMGIAIREGTSFPVGKVNRLTLYPLSFREFLCATGKESLCEIIDSGNPDTICSMKGFFKEELRNYYITGGMPEVLKEYIQSKDLTKCREIQEDLLDFYKKDFAKHAEASLVPRLYQVWDSIPSQLAKENRKYIYGQVEKGARAKNFELAIQWLKDCGLIYKVHRVSKPGIPLKTYEEMSAFKIFMHDVGILGAMGGLPVSAVVEGNGLFSEFKGALTEQYVLQQMVSDMGKIPFYFSEENSRGEIDFLIQTENTLLPIEVKAEENLRAKSLRAFTTKYNVSRGARISMSDYRKQDWLTNYPLYGFMGIIK